MRNCANGFDVGYCNLDGTIYFENEKALTEAVIAGTAAKGPWVKVVTVKILELPE
jgi:hypothetical protein